ncbi:RIP metalloprotease RseP [Nannocystis sp.]|uniref:RIP metalloprotease RseP n=1 Tax=Nannocystis sp. TaxID=1962667 RepID=UPI0024243FC6|nr:RIP metalloprotease RseP [Nannocystis sp.]MBK7827743.1 RIP metalloprotease RseP [Nannocystis sp.]MBK9753784.1 RIP metalloprotease RseP [Nannocystis sp.]
MTYFLAFILLIGPLIFIHELGHLLAAKLVGVKAVRFSLGFGPALARVQIGETEYRIAPIPLGGYVTLLGASPDEELSPQDADRALRNKPLWARYLVLGAGPAFNLLLPLFIYFAFFLGHTVVAPPIIGTVLDDSAAAASDLQSGDRIVAIEGDDIHAWQEMQDRVRVAPGRELRLQIERDGVRFDRFVTPRKSVAKNMVGEHEARGLLGVTQWVYAPQIGIIDTDSPAHAEGLQTGDIITSVNGEPVETIEGLERELERSRDGALRLTYLRPQAVRGELGRYLWFDSYHARLLPRHERGQSTGLLPANTFVRTVEPDSPAAKAGIAPGDRVLAVADRPVTRWETVAVLLDRQGEQPLALTVQSPGQAPREVQVTQEIRSYRGLYKDARSYLWFGAEPYHSRMTPPPEPIRGRFTYAMRSALTTTGSMLMMMWTTLRQMVTGERGVEELSSVVGIFDVAGTAANQGWAEFLRLMALLSINLGFVNLLPIPILDGGHLMFFTIEALRRRPLSQRAREIASAIGLVIILLLLLIALRNDVMRIWMD